VLKIQALLSPNPATGRSAQHHALFSFRWWSWWLFNKFC